MKGVEEYAAEYRSVVQREIPDEQVLAVGVLSRPGSLGNALLSQLSPLAAVIKNRHAKGQAAGLPQNVVTAVTATRVIFFDFRPKMSSIKLKDRVLELRRSEITVGSEANTLATRLTFRCADGSTFELDSNRSIGQYQRLNDELFALLGVAATA